MNPERGRDPHGSGGRRLAPLLICTLLLTTLTASASAQEPQGLSPLEPWLDGCFATSLACARCHSNAPGATAMRDQRGRDIAPFDLWRSSMMANSARDPLWRAAVSVEVAMNPGHRAMIEAKCMRCHTPMAAIEKEHDGTTVTMAELYDPEARHNQLALDGVSCTVCHRIEPEGLGQPETFSGHFKIGSKRRIYGPHADPFEIPMLAQVEYEPTKGDHITSSALCGSCHTLTTTALDAAGNLTDTAFLEQSPYLEWRNSVYNDEREEPDPAAASCQDCHAPLVDADGEKIRTRIARNPVGGDFPPVVPREPYGRHIFVGGNTLIPAILRDHAETLRPNAPREAFDATIALARHQLRHDTARISVTRLGWVQDRLRIRVSTENLTGHKFPTAHPTRRAWLRVIATDDEGKQVFASGAHDERGRILGRDGAPLETETLAGGFQPHHGVIRKADQVQIYEVALGDVEGKLTFGLMRAARHLKDNRLLPRGWRADRVEAGTEAVGVDGDGDFRGGGDGIIYEIPVSRKRGSLQVQVTLLYQTLGSRYAAELLKWDTPAVREFTGYYRQARVGPEVVAEQTVTVRLTEEF